MSIRLISTEQLRHMGNQEGMILQGCGGDPQEWVDGINEILAQEGISKTAGADLLNALGLGNGTNRYEKADGSDQLDDSNYYYQSDTLISALSTALKANATTVKNTLETKELTAKIKAAENRMAEIAVLKTHIINYAKTKDIYTAYRKAGYSKKYYDAHESNIIIHKAAKKAFDDLALKKLPTVKSLQAEYSDLLVQKKLDYAALAKAREEARQLQIYMANAEMLLRTDVDEQRQAREHQQEK